MGIIDIYKKEYLYNEEEKKGKYELVCNGLIFSNTFLNSLNFKKVRKPFNCSICEKEKPKNTRYIGDSYQKICVDCFSEWVENSIKELEKMKTIILKNKTDLELNKEKWRKEMIIGALS